MAWASRQHSKTRIDRAGVALLDPSATPEMRDQTLEIVNNWRSSHAFPLNTLQTGLRKTARSIDSGALVAQRIKRLASIELKLRRFPTMTLSQMQDLGGCRAIVKDAAAAIKLAETLRRGRMKHRLHTIDDYIKAPQSSGYRGIHIIYKYFSDRNDKYNSQKIEMQLRSAPQHAWATAVETVGTFTRHALKSSIGPDQWLRFFSLMGTVIAVLEGTSRVPDTPENNEVLLAELRAVAGALDVVTRLTAYGAALQGVNDVTTRDARYFLIELDPEAQRTIVTGFKSDQLEFANQRYLAVERKATKASFADAVLVSVENIAVLRRAYPNYFLDTQIFLRMLSDALAVRRLRRRRGSTSARRVRSS